MLTLFKSLSLVLVMISSMSVPICNYFTVDELIAVKKTLLRGYPSSMPACTGLLKRRGLGLRHSGAIHS